MSGEIPKQAQQPQTPDEIMAGLARNLVEANAAGDTQTAESVISEMAQASKIFSQLGLSDSKPTQPTVNGVDSTDPSLAPDRRRNISKRAGRIVGGVALTFALAGAGFAALFGGGNGNIANAEAGARDKADLDKLNRTELIKEYGNTDKGSDLEGLITDFLITEDAEGSEKRLFGEIRHNPQMLAEAHVVFIDTKNPDYDNATTKDKLARMKNLNAQFETMPLERKAEIAERVIAEIEKAKFVGVEFSTGPDKTIVIKDNGGDELFLRAIRNHTRDARLVYEVEGEDGKVRRVAFRECGQIVEKTPARIVKTNPPRSVTPPTEGRVGIPRIPQPEGGPDKPDSEPPARPKRAHTTPAGVVGHNGGSGVREGSPTGTGKGGINQVASPSGVVGGEVTVANPAPAPTPEPVKTVEAPAVQPGEVTGSGPTVAPAEDAKGADKPAPTTEVNPDG